MTIDLTDFIDELDSLKEYLTNETTNRDEAKARVQIVIKDLKKWSKKI